MASGPYLNCLWVEYKIENDVQEAVVHGCRHDRVSTCKVGGHRKIELALAYSISQGSISGHLRRQ